MKFEKRIMKCFDGLNRLEHRRDILRVLVDEHSQKVVKSGNESSNASQGDGVDIKYLTQDFLDSKQKAGNLYKIIFMMPFASQSALELRQVLSEYGNRLLEHREKKKPGDNRRETGDQDDKVHASDLEKPSKYFEHLLANAQDLSITELANGLRDLHEFLIKRVENNMKKLMVSETEELEDQNRNRSLSEAAALVKVSDSLQSAPEKSKDKMRRNEIVWEYVKSLQDLLKLDLEVSSQKLGAQRTGHLIGSKIITSSRSPDQLSQATFSQIDEMAHLQLQGQMKTSKREIQSLEGSSQRDDTTEAQNTDASDSRSWPVLNADEIKHNYPKDVKPDDVWSVLHNDSKWELSQQQQKQRLDAIALRATEWLINHGWDVRSNDAKRALYEKVRGFFYTETKATAKKLFECVVRQDKKNKQAWIARTGHYIVNATPFTHDKLQSAKMDLVKSFEELSARDRRINKKVARFNELHWSEKIFKRGGGFRYERNHAREMDALNKKLQYNEVIEPKLKEIETKSGEMKNEFQAKIHEWREKCLAEELSDEKRYQLFTEGLGLLMTAVSKGLVDVHANQEKLTLLNSYQLERTGENIVEAIEHTSKGVFGSLAMDTLSGMIAAAALVMGIKAASHGTA